MEGPVDATIGAAALPTPSRPYDTALAHRVIHHEAGYV
jgi:hypothetical protein